VPLSSPKLPSHENIRVIPNLPRVCLLSNIDLLYNFDDLSLA
jgi:hypothetical protein